MRNCPVKNKICKSDISPRITVMLNSFPLLSMINYLVMLNLVQHLTNLALYLFSGKIPKQVRDDSLLIPLILLPPIFYAFRMTKTYKPTSHFIVQSILYTGNSFYLLHLAFLCSFFYRTVVLIYGRGYFNHFIPPPHASLATSLLKRLAKNNPCTAKALA